MRDHLLQLPNILPTKGQDDSKFLTGGWLTLPVGDLNQLTLVHMSFRPCVCLAKRNVNSWFMPIQSQFFTYNALPTNEISV